MADRSGNERCANCGGAEDEHPIPNGFDGALDGCYNFEPRSTQFLS